MAQIEDHKRIDETFYGTCYVLEADRGEKAHGFQFPLVGIDTYDICIFHDRQDRFLCIMFPRVAHSASHTPVFFSKKAIHTSLKNGNSM